MVNKNPKIREFHIIRQEMLGRVLAEFRLKKNAECGHF